RRRRGGSAAGRLTQPGDVMNRRRTLPKRIYGRPSRHSTTTAVSNMRANNKFRCPPLGDADFPYNTSHQRGFEGSSTTTYWPLRRHPTDIGHRRGHHRRFPKHAETAFPETG